MRAERQYVETHPWITFQVPLDHAPPKLWMLLGEAASKCENLATSALIPETAQFLHTLYLAKGVLATTAIEGNTLTEEQVLALLEGELQLPPSKEYLAQEVENILACCNAVRQAILDGVPLELSPAVVADYNEHVLEGLELEEGVVPGQIRHKGVAVGGIYQGAPSEDCDYLVRRLCEWLEMFDGHAGQRVQHAILKAVLAHLYLAWIHPFGDGNGRTARLVEFQVLVAAGVPTPAAHLLSNHYNHTRTEYYRQLNRASRSGGDVIPFIVYALQGLVDELRGQLEVVRDQQRKLVWRYYLEEIVFPGHNNPTQERRKQIAIELAEGDLLIRRSDLRLLSPRLAEMYAGKTDRTITRDANWLISQDLLVRHGPTVRANHELLEAFLPIRVKDEEEDL